MLSPILTWKTVDSAPSTPDKGSVRNFNGRITVFITADDQVRRPFLPGAAPPGPPAGALRRAHGPTRKGTRANARAVWYAHGIPRFFIFLFCRLRCRMVLHIPISMIGKKWHAAPPPPPINFFRAGRNGSKKIFNTPLEKILGTPLWSSYTTNGISWAILQIF